MRLLLYNACLLDDHSSIEARRSVTLYDGEGNLLRQIGTAEAPDADAYATSDWELFEVVVLLLVAFGVGRVGRPSWGVLAALGLLLAHGLPGPSGSGWYSPLREVPSFAWRCRWAGARRR